MKGQRTPFARRTSRRFPATLLAAVLLLVAVKLWDMSSGFGLTGHPLPGLKEMTAAAGQQILQQIWDRFYPAPAMEGTGRERMGGEADPSYRAAKDVEAFFQEHRYLALYGNEETGGPDGGSLWEPGMEVAENGGGTAGGPGAAGTTGGSGAAGMTGEPGVAGGSGVSGMTGGAGASGIADASSIAGTAGGSGGAGSAGTAGKDVPGAGEPSGDGTFEDGSRQAVLQDKVVVGAVAFPGRTYQLAQLQDYDFLMSHFYSVHTSTTADRELMDAKKLLLYDFRLGTGGGGQENDSQQVYDGQQGNDGQQGERSPQILIYHTHSQEAFAGSREGETIVGAGSYLAQLLEARGFSVYHDCTVYDVKDGKLDRNKAYTYALEGIEKILEEYPSIQVVIDLHRDGVRPGTHLVTEVDGKPTAQIMFFNGLSQTPDGPIPYLENPYREDNLAFSLQLQLKAEAYFPNFARKIYLKGLRYNLHVRPRSCLVEAGAQTNTYEEVLNAMEPLAEVFTMVLRGK